jgi:uncharacterized membrane protein YdjX (TVP38/TMEM64 family)
VGIAFSILPVGVSLILNAKTSNFWLSYLISIAISIVAPAIGGLLAFAVSRNILVSFAGYLKSKYRVYRAVERVLGDRSQSIQIQLLLRLSPILPTAALNMVLGATSNCRLFPEFVTAMALGNLAYAVPLSYLGCLIHSLADIEDTDDLDVTSPIGMGMAIVGGVASVGVTVAITCYTKKKLRLILEDERRTSEEGRHERMVGEKGGVERGVGPTLV